jgi:hypothetical protein
MVLALLPQRAQVVIPDTPAGFKPTHLNDLWERKSDATQQYWTLPYVPGKRLESKPAYVLTLKRTSSGAEEFSYNLKNLKRAPVVGETTGGGAHPVSGHRIDAVCESDQPHLQNQLGRNRC